MPFRRPKHEDPYHKGRPGTRWALMEKFVISRDESDPYLTRWRIVHTPWFGVLLHKIQRPDGDPVPHDHPWNFGTLILKGGYTEQVVHRGIEGPIAYRVSRLHKWKPGSYHKMRRGAYHRIVKLAGGGPCWTLVLTGPRRGDWGFLTPEGHIPWKEYLGV